MVRTIVSLLEGDKRWLDQYSSQHNQSTAEVIREAVRAFQKNTATRVWQESLKKTAGILKSKVDAAQTVRELRSEWD